MKEENFYFKRLDIGNTERNGLDFSRSILMIFGVFYHAGLIFSVDSSWAVKSLENSVFFNSLTNFISSFRMHAFFVISGFLWIHVLIGKSFGKSVTKRVASLVIPMFFVGFTVNTLVNLRVGLIDSNTNYWNYIYNGDWLRHTWFLGNLFIYSMIIAFLFKFKILHLFIVPIINKKIHFLFFIICFPTFVYFIQTNLWRIDGYQNIFFITPRYFFQHAPYFLSGLLLYFIATDFKKILLPPTGIIYFYVITSAIFFLVSHNIELNGWIREYVSLVLTFLSVSTLLALSRSVHEQLTLDLINASYTIYLIHSPFIILVFSIFLNIHYGIYISRILFFALRH